jgi:hypothetical protein
MTVYGVFRSPIGIRQAQQRDDNNIQAESLITGFPPASSPMYSEVPIKLIYWNSA